MTLIRTAAKKALEGFAVGIGVDRCLRWLRRDRVLILAYHNVVPDSSPRIGDTSLHLHVSDFARQLDLLCRTGEIVGLENLLAGAKKEKSDTLSFAITFDDGYRGSFTLGVRELQRRGLPATFFVAPAILGDQTFWWDALYEAAGDSLTGLWEQILTEGNGTLSVARRLALARGLGMKTMPELWRSAHEDELHQALRVPGIRIASHSWSHACLVRLSTGALEKELAESRQWLRDRFGKGYLDVLSYPYGSHSAPVRDAARNAGYQAACALEAGSMRVSDVANSTGGAFKLPRLNVPSRLSLSGLRLRAAWC